MPSTTHLPTSYEEVPYISIPFRESHPMNFAPLAQLFGMSPRPIEQSRVLELGCAAGGNLLPMAEAFPTATFIGIDSSEREIDDGLVMLRELALSNVELKRASITDIDDSWGKFDYIIAHGVYSWVPQDVRDHLLKVCSRNLQPQGVAYVSYNTLPGWHSRGVIRDLMCFAGRNFEDARARLAAGRGALELMTKILANANDPYGLLLKRETEFVRKSHDHYLFHDHISQHNDPVYFHDFAADAQRVGLQYLSEANPVHLSLHNPQVDQIIRSMSSDVIEIEQYMDFVRNRAFRQTLLCHADVALQRSSGPGRLAGLYVACEAKPVAQSIDLAPGVPAQFRLASGQGMSITSPLAKSALLDLSERWPANVRFEELAEGAIQTLDAKIDHASESLGRDLLRIYAGGALELSTAPSPFTTAISVRPVASLLARLQSRRERIVTSRRHMQVELPEQGAKILQLLDGMRDLPAIAKEIGAAEENVTGMLRLFAQTALLID